MYKYIDQSDSSHLQSEELYKTIRRKLNDFINYILSSKDKKWLLIMINEVYHKRYKSIRANSDNDTEVMLAMIMALLIEHNKEVKRLKEEKASQ
jgi:phosphoribulokinase